MTEREPFTLAWLEEGYPSIKWREPVAVTTPRGSGWDCRVCIASFGKKPSDGPRFATPEEASEHIEGHP
jgi:hypothetical protein